MDRYIPPPLTMEQVTSAYAEQPKEFVSQGIETPALDFRTKSNAKDYGVIPFTPNELKSIEQAIFDEEMEAKCKPELFKDEDRNVRFLKAEMINLYYELEGDWNLMRKHPKCVGTGTLKRYWMDPVFRACIMALDELLTLEGEGVVKELMRHAADPRVKLEAAKSWLRAKKPEEWNPAVQKQVVANKGSLQNTLFKNLVSQEEFKKMLATDPFSPLPEAARLAMQQTEVKEPVVEPLEAQVISNTMPVDPFLVDE